MTLPPPGWYQDPLNPDRQKWWDGTAWTDYTAPLGSAASETSAETAEAGQAGPHNGSPAEPAAVR